MFELFIVILVIAFVFDFINGFHDSANSIATIVSTRVLTPFQAVVWAAFFNVVAYWISEFKVADTVAKTVDASSITLTVIFAGLVAAIIWNLLTWWAGIPSSSSHTLMGGFAGAAIAHAGFGVVNTAVLIKTVTFIVLAPLIGMVLSYMFSIILLWSCRKANPFKMNGWFKRAQLLSSALFSIGHGGNDAQKVMGIIAATMMVYISQAGIDPNNIPAWMNVTVVNGKIKDIPHWVVLGCYSAIGLGTLMGGWRIVKTMGSRITKLTPFEGVAAETAGAVTLYASQSFGIPVSTTHTITGSIMGVGLTKRISAVRWGVTFDIIWAWVLTIPVSGGMGALFYYIMKQFLPE